MSRNFSGIKILRVSRKDSLQRQQSTKRTTTQQGSSKISQSNVTHPSTLKKSRSFNVSVSHSELTSNSTKTIVDAKENKVNDEGQNHQDSILAKKQTNQSNLFDFTRDSFPINSITNSTTCFDLSVTHRSLNRNHRISPINNCRDLFKDGMTFNINERNYKKRKNKKKSNISPCKISLCILVLLLLIGGVIGLLFYAMSQSKNSETTTISSMLTTTLNSVCTTGGSTCPTPMFVWNRTNNCTTPYASYVYYSCCFRAVSTQLSIEFILREDISNWFIDDVSMTQGNGELIINGGFESNLTGWTVTSAIGNLSVTPVAKYSPSVARFNSTNYLHSEGVAAADHVKQTVNVVQGQNVNVSFWWRDLGGVAGPSEVCEAIVKLIP